MWKGYDYMVAWFTYATKVVLIDSRRTGGVLDTTFSDNICPWPLSGLWCHRILASSITKADQHEMTKVLLKVTQNNLFIFFNLTKFVVFLSFKDPGGSMS